VSRRRAPAPPADPYPVRVLRSRRRKRSVSARLVEGVLELTVPSWLSDGEAIEFADRMQARFARKRTHASTDLMKRAKSLATRYDLPAPSSVRWVANQSARWGSCSIDDGSVRLSDRMIGMPDWVVDAVLVHELAHLVHADHGPAFKALEARYERQVEASAFLDGVVWAGAQRPNDDTSADAERGDQSPCAATSEASDAPSTVNPAIVDLRGDDPVELERLDGRLDVVQLRLDLSEELGSEAKLG
jgi:predicted metal-dependent hydrolase